MIPIVVFVGYSGSGKTTIASGVINVLSSKGYKVATIKHDGHDHLQNIDVSKDSGKHKFAGAVASIFFGKHGFEMLCDTTSDTSPEELLSLLPANIDIVICEGFKNSALPKIEVFRKGGKRSNDGDPYLIAIATDDNELTANIPVLDVNSIQGVACFIESWFVKKSKDVMLHLIVDGKPVPMKDFVLKMLTYSIQGLIKPLKGCEDPKEIVIKAVYPKK